MPTEFVGDNRHRQQETEQPQDPGERRAADQNRQLDMLEAKIGAGPISQESAGHLRAIETSARDWRVKQRARKLRDRARTQPLTKDQRGVYQRGLSSSNPGW